MTQHSFSLNGKGFAIVTLPGKFVAYLPEHNIIWYQMPVIRGRSVFEIPDGYELIGPGMASEISEAEAAKVVELWGYKDKPIWRDYNNPKDWFPTALESLASLIRSKGFEPNESVMLKKL